MFTFAGVLGVWETVLVIRVSFSFPLKLTFMKVIELITNAAPSRRLLSCKEPGRVFVWSLPL